ncbi:pilus assembly protein TadG-related protein [Streptomyces sp. NPDC049687]|uniref:pilus assembly protein TadG-related protein n=1 Tax=Streptomyces sp. NPDC049687 TaxID=3365596 RepID=UPI0037AD5228
MGPSSGSGVPSYVPHASASNREERHERPAAEDRHRGQAPGDGGGTAPRRRRQGADRGGVSGDHRGGGGDRGVDREYESGRDHRQQTDGSDRQGGSLTRRRARGDGGQAFPIYITVVAGLLFLAFAYFAVGQAAVNRNGAQTAADAAALAAAQETRDQLAGQWELDVRDPTKWQDIFDGVGATDSCWRATELASMNDAGTVQCIPDGHLSYSVTVQTNKAMGDSVVPITSTKRSHASATAVIEPLCSFELPGDDAEDDALPTLTCDDVDWELDPEDLTDLPGPEDLFDVHLTTG